MTGSGGLSERVNLSILTPEELLFEGQAEWLQVPLEDGLVGIWPGHSPMVGAIGSGTLSFQAGGETREMPVSGGILRLSVERCAVLLSAGPAASPTPLDTEVLASDLEDALHDILPEDQIEALQEGRR